MKILIPHTHTCVGDIMSFPNLDHLLILPRGCGEQNLVRTAVNYVVGKYLSSTEALKDHVAVKIKNNLQIGKTVFACTFVTTMVVITMKLVRLSERAQLSWNKWVLQYMA